jgi:hypothetical protein
VDAVMYSDTMRPAVLYQFREKIALGGAADIRAGGPRRRVAENQNYRLILG